MKSPNFEYRVYRAHCVIGYVGVQFRLFHSYKIYSKAFGASQCCWFSYWSLSGVLFILQAITLSLETILQGSRTWRFICCHVMTGFTRRFISCHVMAGSTWRFISCHVIAGYTWRFISCHVMAGCNHRFISCHGDVRLVSSKGYTLFPPDGLLYWICHDVVRLVSSNGYMLFPRP